MPERRRSPRQKSLLRGIVYFENSPCATECIVRDISDTGARLKFSALPLEAVDSLELEIPLKAIKHKCRITWRTDYEVGVNFGLTSATQGADEASMVERINRLEAEIMALKLMVERLQRNAKKEQLPDIGTG